MDKDSILKDETVVLATSNRHKAIEIIDIMKGVLGGLLTLAEAGIFIDIEETGSTLMENALIKARTICKMIGKPALADDTGLMVDALNGEPGVYSARYAGEEHDDAKNRAKLLKNLEGVENRNAHFSTCVALCYPDGRELTAEGRVDGVILSEERGENGFGYDSLFYSTELQKTFAEATEQEKNLVSHRARALEKLMDKLWRS